MRKVCLDTDMSVDYLRDRRPMSEEVQRWFDTKDVDVYATGITSFELYYGAFYSKNIEESVKEVGIFLKNMRSKNKTVIIGIDGVPFGLLENLAEKGVMPNFAALKRECQQLPC